ncbi:MAG: hypothetical protein KKA67_01140 [Spirochaetes bacterium]|nr:hypothetical protein [Spirochaetota bacterium]MBU1081278.1 hypothetical protein [Spirochaetota bacterium]
MISTIRRSAAAAVSLAAGLAIAGVPAAAQAASYAARPPQASSEYLFGVPEGQDLRRLVDRPTLAGTTYYVFEDPASGDKRLGGYAEVLAVYDMPLEALWAVLVDFESYPSFSPRILGSVVEATSDGDDGTVYRLRYTTGIRFLGIEVSYVALEDVTAVSFDDGARATRTRLVESLDGSVFEHFSSFYLSPVTVDGHDMTFVRYFSRPGINKPGFGMLQVVQFFAPPEGKAQVSSVAKEAARRIKALGASPAPQARGREPRP